MTEEDRRSSSAPPLHFDIEVDLLSSSSAENDEDFSHFRRLQSSTSTLLLQLATANSAITPSTTFDFQSVTLSDSSLASKLTVLVNDPTKTRGITAMSVNTSTGKVSGIQRGRSGNVRKLDMFDIQGGEIVEALKPQMRMFMEGVTRAKHESFTCGVEHKEEWDDRRRLRQDDDEWKGVRGNVDADMHHHDHEHNHDEHNHDVIDHFRMLQNSNAAFKPPTSERLYESGGPSVRFQINIIIDIDAEFIQKQGGADEAIEYVNFLVTVANTILMNEVGLMLNVVHVQEVTYFESAVTLREGLKLMKDQYDGKFPGIQLRHALLGKYIGGGIAFIDTVCDKRYAVGLSSGLEGSIGHLDHDAVYDLFIFLHEIGHSLGSGKSLDQVSHLMFRPCPLSKQNDVGCLLHLDHTFEEAFKPRVDTCGLDRCPKALPQANSASIMSYCDFCSGGLSNVSSFLYTLMNFLCDKSHCTLLSRISRLRCQWEVDGRENILDWQSGIGYPARKLNPQVFPPNLSGLVIKYGRLSIQRDSVWSGKLTPQHPVHHMNQLLLAQRNIQVKVQHKNPLSKSR